MANTKEIDAIDARILKMLLAESRTSFTEIAENCGISVCAVRMRFCRLKKAAIIIGEKMHVDPKFWGYEHVADVRVKAFPGDEEKVRKLLNSRRYIISTGNFGNAIMGLAVLPKIEYLRNIVEDIEAHPRVKKVETLIWVKSLDIYHPENLIIKPYTELSEYRVEPKTAPAKTVEVHIDETDKQIIRVLANSSRKSFSAIAEELSISIRNVIHRYRKLREGNVITRSAISVDLNKLGYKAMSVNFLKLEAKSKVSEICQQLLQIPNATSLIEHMGVYDLRVDIPIADIEDIFLISEQIRRIKGIESIDSTIVGRDVPPYPFPLYNKIISD